MRRKRIKQKWVPRGSQKGKDSNRNYHAVESRLQKQSEGWKLIEDETEASDETIKQLFDFA